MQFQHAGVFLWHCTPPSSSNPCATTFPSPSTIRTEYAPSGLTPTRRDSPPFASLVTLSQTVSLAVSCEELKNVEEREKKLLFLFFYQRVV